MKMSPAWFLFLGLWVSDVTLPTHALLIVPNGLRHSLKKRDAGPPTHNVRVSDLHVETHIENRYAVTRISSRIANSDNVSQEVYFNFVIPETAFISSFKMMVENKVYEAHVKEKDAAKREYKEAVSRGQTAAHVAALARDSNHFTVSVNVEPTKKVTFNLTYDELLIRRLGAYNLAINLDPGKLVHRMSVDVYIKEKRNITLLRVPELRTGNEVDADETTTGNSLATIVRPSATEAHVSFSPTTDQQKSLGHIGANPGSKAKKSLKGQFVLQYDVDREDSVDQLLVSDGYFVHFFAPQNLTPLRKHAIFVLDVSGSMMNNKIRQLKEAMRTILDSLNEGDHFSIIEFSTNVKVWNLDDMTESVTLRWRQPWHVESDSESSLLASTFPATASYIHSAQLHIMNMRSDGGTNIRDALKVGLGVARRGQVDSTAPTPVIVFLTDGQPTGASTAEILDLVKERNRDPATAIFSLAFGGDADFDFLKKLSLRNRGFARKIYEASDAALQLRDFYRQIASPLLMNVSFTYDQDRVVQESMTRTHFPSLFLGSEIVIAGKLQNEVLDSHHFEVDSVGIARSGEMKTHLDVFVPARNFSEAHGNRTVTHMEKLWGYLTIKQLLEDREKEGADNIVVSNRQRALALALKYSFVTPLTSLVVVKPNSSELAENTTSEVIGDGSPYRAWQHGRTGSRHVIAQPQLQHHKHTTGGGTSDLLLESRITTSRQSTRRRMRPNRFDSGDPQMIAGEPPRYNFPTSHEPVVQTTATPVAEAPALVSLDQLKWLEGGRGAHEVTLPFGSSETNVTYRLLLIPGTFEYRVHKPCTTKAGVEGFCHHLKDCPLNVIKDDIQSYSVYFCTLNNDAGVCCPKDLSKPTNDIVEVLSDESI